MNEPYNFTVVIDNVGAYGWDTKHQDVTLYAFVSGKKLAWLSGSLIEVTTGCYLKDIGVSGSRATNLPMFQLTLNDNSYMSTGLDEVYYSTIYHYYGGIILDYYVLSASAIDDMENLTIDQLSFYSIE